MKRCVAYTAIFGGKDKVENFVWNADPADCLCFTDDAQAVNPAITVVKCKKIKTNPARRSKIFKLLPHVFLRDYDYSIWLDGNARIRSSFNMQELLDIYLKTNDLALFAHPFRDCAYEEIEGGLVLRNKSYRYFLKQRKNYQAAGLPTKAGLAACGFMLRRHTPGLSDFCAAWWKDTLKYTTRDQPSFGFISWKLKYPYTIIPGSVMDNEHFSIVSHEK